MALPILDGNQSATTLSSILTSGEHIPAHTVVSLGTQAITDISGAVSGSVVSISNFPATQPVSIASVTIGNTVTIAGTVTANPTGTQTIAGTVTANLSTAVSPSIGSTYGDGDRYPVGTTIIPVGGWTAEIDGAHWQALTLTESGELATVASLQPSVHRIGVVTIGAGTVTIGAGTAQIGSVTASNLTSALAVYEGGNSDISVNIKSVGGQSFDQGQTWVPVAISEGSLPAGTNRIGVVTIGAGTVTIGAGTAQIGSVTASISGTVPISISSVTVGNSVTIGSLPAISGTVTVGNAIQIQSGNISIEEAFGNGSFMPISGTVTISNSVTIGSLPAISGTVTANTFALQGTAVTTSNFTSTTASTVLAGYNATREVLTIFNEGAGNLHVCAGATCTTIAYQVRLSAGDYYEAPNHQTTITHSAVFAAAGTARVTEVS